MSMTRSSARRWRTAAVAVAALVAGTTAAVGGSAGAVDTANCPPAFPVSDLTEGLVANGLTVEKGTTAEPFTAEIIGVIDDGIGPDVDMIIAETDSPAIQRAGGIWAGMSGSPVYAPDGRLIGAVSYGLSLAPSNVAGITPAADMLKVLDRPGATESLTAARTAKRVEVPTSLQRKMVQSGSATSSEADGGMRRLPLPVAVSGLNRGNRLAKFSERLGKQVSDVRVHSAAAASAGSAASPADIFPGSNFASALAYGDLTAAGVGTTTAVCDGGKALAFGHPFLWSGASTMSVHAADAVFVQRDDTLGSYKVANAGGIVGTLDQDRLAAIRGVLGAGPATVPVLSTVRSTDPGGASRSGRTDITLPDFVPTFGAFHLLSNFDTVADRIGGGTSEVGWLIEGERASGAPFTVDVKNKFADQFDISFGSIFSSFGQLARIVDNPFEDAKITKVTYDGSISSVFKRYSMESVQLKLPDGTLAPIAVDRPLPVVTGSKLNLRVTLAPYKNIGEKRTADLSLTVPSSMAGGFGTVDVTGGSGEGEFDDGGSASAKNFDELLAEMRATAPNNSVNATLNVGRETASGFTSRQTKARSVVDQVVNGLFSFNVEVLAAPKGLPAVVDNNVWKLRTSLSGGAPSSTFYFGNSTYRQLMGDWDGDGSTSPAVFKDGKWYVRMTPTSSSRIFTFGQAGDIPVAGDWNGDGKDDIGVYRNGRWLQRDSVNAGPATRDFTFGASGWRPVAGDWNGNGVDTVGVFSNGSWKTRNYNSAGAPSATFTFGAAGDVPVAGDWDRSGADTPGLYRGGKWIYRNALTSGASSSFTFGGSSSRPVVWSE